MTRRYFHVYADRKTVRELTGQEYNRLSQELGYACAWMDDADIVFVKGSNVNFLSLEQLRQILNAAEKQE